MLESVRERVPNDVYVYLHWASLVKFSARSTGKGLTEGAVL